MSMPTVPNTSSSFNQSNHSPLFGLPKGLTVEEKNGELIIKRVWRNWIVVVFFTMFSVMWNSGMFFIVSAIIKIQQYEYLFFLMLHIPIGIGVAYHTICLIFNTTTIFCDRTKFSIKHHPLPYRGGRLISTHEIKQLYCKEIKGRKTTSYEVRLIDNRNNDVTLVSGLEVSEQALYVEQKVEQFLGIKQQDVRGAMN